ncbi:TonB-dependent receptor [Myxococcota bacterium]|nr:TonB-dependent receptor [Myxococcota bacterium]MBU1413747.1 TonB-dependent receptor [Myxococcota bacterium]MBU1511989.1 TonB-dependent receptor [Myxococcota bacterium]
MKTHLLILLLIIQPVVAGVAAAQAPDPPPAAPPADEDEIAVKPVRKSDVVPPKVLHMQPPVYPENAYAEPPGVSVVLKILVTVDGVVDGIEVTKSGGEAFDQAAKEAMVLWKFAPATYEGKPVAVRIAVPFEFPPRARPKAPVKTDSPVDLKRPFANPDPAGAKPQGRGTVAPTPAKDGEVLVHGVRKIQRLPVVGSFVVDRKILAAAPQPTAADMLRTVPGFYVGHPQADGIANALFMRGFNAEHGQDFELFAGEVPINLLGHLHAQGYADMHFLIPEVISSLDVIEGVFDPQQGDFAVAGSGFFRYGVAARGTRLALTLGSFNYRRLLFIHAPRGGHPETFLAVALKSGDGYGPGNRSSESITAIGRYHLTLGTRTSLTLHAGAYAGRSVLPGLMRLDDYTSGAYGFFDSYSYPTAQAQSGYFTRMEVSLKLVHDLSALRERWELSLYALRTDFMLRQNLSGFLLWYPDEPELRGAGDLHLQTNLDDTLGAKLQYFSGKMRLMDHFPTEFTAGVQVRSGMITQREDLIFPAQNMIWRHLVDAEVNVLHAGAFVGSTTRFFPWLTLHAGARADGLAFFINDELGNRQYNVPTEQAHQLGYKRNAFGTHVGPRVMLEAGPFARLVSPLDSLRAFAAWGQGFRSPPPRSLQEGESAPFTQVDSAEVGLKFAPWGERVALFRLSAFYTYLDKDYIFDPTTARTTPIGDTTRTGGVFSVHARPWRELTLSASWTYAQAVLEGPPLATPENPTPGEKKGDLVPYVPPHVGRVDLSWNRRVVDLGGAPVAISAGLGSSYLSRRPLPYSEWADPVFLLDLQAQVTWREFSFRLEATNVLDSRWHDMDFNFVSQWNPDQSTNLPARHFVAGAPRTIMGTLEIRY